MAAECNVLTEAEASTRLLHFDPLLAFRAGKHSVADFLGFECFAESGRRGFVFREAVEEVGNVVDERVFVANL